MKAAKSFYPIWASVQRWKVLFFLLLGFSLLYSIQAEPIPSEWKKEFRSFSSQLLSPLFSQPTNNTAWEIEISGTMRAKKDDIEQVQSGRLLILWDDENRAFIQLDAPFSGLITLASDSDGSRFIVTRQQKVFTDSQPLQWLSTSLFSRAIQQLIAFNASGLILWPKDKEVSSEGKDLWNITSKQNGDKISIQGSLSSLPLQIKWNARNPGEFTVNKWGISTGAKQNLTQLLHDNPFSASNGTSVIQVDAGQLSEMLRAVLEFGEEKIYAQVAPTLLPNLMKDVPRIDGRPTIIVKGTPEEIGKSYGQQLRQATIYNSRKILFGFALYQAIEKGEWFPHTLMNTFERQRKWLPKVYIREMDALADEVGLPKEYIYAVNIFPEFFHCSGLALLGNATINGQLLHGRILDYMTEIGIQRTAVTVIVIPKDRHTWINIGYAGCVGTVTCMNEKGLAMGEMGGRGEGYLDGIPMTFLMREVAECYETTQNALSWIRSIPRSCEYFYVLSDAKTDEAVTIGSWSSALAKEKGLGEDIFILKPGETNSFLPRAVPDTCLLGSSSYYNRLVDRVQAQQGKITPELAWKIMGAGVARTSALHIVLFMPDTLDCWIAEASETGLPAYTQPIHKINLGAILNSLQNCSNPITKDVKQ